MEQDKTPQQTKLEVGAGLQEGRINEEFKDFLERWSLPVLAVVAVLVGIYSGSKYYDSWRESRRDAAFVELENARGEIGIGGLREGSPDSLIAIADELEGRGSASLIARLDAADIYLGAVRRGIAPGTNLADFSNEAFVQGEVADEMLAKAGEQYERVANRTKNSDARITLYIRAMFGAASVATTQGDAEKARTLLTQLAERAEALGFDGHAAVARAKLERIGQWAEPVALLSIRDLDPTINNPNVERLDDETLLLKPLDPSELPEALRNDPSIYPEGFGQPDNPEEGEQPAPTEGENPSPAGQDEQVPAPTEPAPAEPAQDEEPDQPEDDTPNDSGNPD